MLQMIAAFAEFESNQRGELISSVMKYLKKEEKVYCGPVPIGFDKIDGKLKVNENEMQLVRKIYLWNKSFGPFKTAMHANENGYRSKKGGKFHTTTIQKIVNNDLYSKYL
jgi:DNA invertase Pin-like site-specific DNA recombinase